MQIAKDSRILLLGATGFLGSAVSVKLQESGIPHDKASLSLGVDFREYEQTREAFARARPTIVINCAAYVGGIQFGLKQPVRIFTDNLLMSVNIYRAVQEFSVGRLINPISNCIYPSRATVFREDEVWEGPLDESVLVYGMARKMHWVGAWAYGREQGLDSMNLVLPNLYGPGDHFDPVRSHALGGLIAKIVKAKRNRESKVIIWGTGRPVREWLYVEDGADALLGALTAECYSGLINVGTGHGISILRVAEMIKTGVGYEGQLELDPSKPDGAPHKTLDGSRARLLLKWNPSFSLEEGLKRTIDWYVSNYGHTD